jgi:hypothetical protein
MGRRWGLRDIGPVPEYREVNKVIASADWYAAYMVAEQSG